ncbi:MAG: Lsr2 family protein [Nocardioidaceae bacterium]|nr:Lsr2 family protein [Nocardioidaceae bacterium]
MAQKVTVNFVSDLTGSVIESDTPTVAFSLDGTQYEIDLTDKEAQKFRDDLAEYVASATKVTDRSNGKSSSKAKSTGPAASDVRVWARENGHDVPDRGRIPSEVKDAYEAAH